MYCKRGAIVRLARAILDASDALEVELKVNLEKLETIST